MTMARSVPSNAALYTAVAVFMALSLAVQIVRDRGWQPFEPPSGMLWIRSAPLAQRLALGFDNLAADIYWIRAVVYFGGQRLSQRERNFDQLYPLLDLVTSLDSHFRVAYRFGAIFLAEPAPAGAGRPNLAIELLQKGLAAHPNRWEYAQDIGFIHYWWARDYARGAEWFKRAGEIPGAPEWLAPLAATTLAEGGSRESSRQLWTELRDTSESEWVKRNASHRLQQLDAMDTIDALNRITEDFAKRHRRPPASWRDLAADQGWARLPIDPTGELFALDPASGRVSLSRESVLWPLPDGSAAASARLPQ